MNTDKNNAQLPQSSVSVSFLSDENLQRCANLYAEQENDCYINDYNGYYNGAKQMEIAFILEIRRRQELIVSEPDGIIREKMISDLLLGLE